MPTTLNLISNIHKDIHNQYTLSVNKINLNWPLILNKQHKTSSLTKKNSFGQG